jgi:hypothetical protein
MLFALISQIQKKKKDALVTKVTINDSRQLTPQKKFQGPTRAEPKTELMQMQEH